MKRLTVFFAAVFFMVIFVGCSKSTSSLVGTYAVEENGQLHEVIRIDRQGDKFTLSEKKGDGWASPVELAPVSKSEFESLIGEPVTVEFTGLSNKGAAIFQVPKGWSAGGFESKTGIWLATMFGPIDLHKQ